MKVFGIGLPRTGTMSLSRAFRTLGFEAHHCYDVLDVPPEIQAGTDTPFWQIFEWLATTYPDARFVQVHRPAQEWIASFKKKQLVEAHQRMVRRWHKGIQRKPRHVVDQHCYLEFFGEQILTDAILLAKHAEHAERVARCFADQPARLLSIALDDLDWEPLCRFLAMPIPGTPFPHTNRSEG